MPVIKSSAKGMKQLKLSLKAFERQTLAAPIVFAEVYSDGNKSLPYSPHNARKQEAYDGDDVHYAKWYEAGNQNWHGSKALLRTVSYIGFTGEKTFASSLSFPFTKREALFVMKELLDESFQYIKDLTNIRTSSLKLSWSTTDPEFKSKSEPGWEADWEVH